MIGQEVFFLYSFVVEFAEIKERDLFIYLFGTNSIRLILISAILWAHVCLLSFILDPDV